MAINYNRTVNPDPYKIYNKMLRGDEVYDHEIEYLNGKYSVVRPKDNLDLRRIVLFYNNYCPEDSLDWLDVSMITTMDYLFSYTHFNGSIYTWNVSRVRSMAEMFHLSQFNNNISCWNVSNVTDMRSMFSRAQFNGDISGWDVSNVKNMAAMFYDNSFFNQDISAWDVSNVESFALMFQDSVFNHDISNWDVSNGYTTDMFKNCPINEKYKPAYFR